MKLMSFIFSILILSGCSHRCDEVSLDKFINNEFCKQYSVTDGDRCVSFLDQEFLDEYGVFSSDYINDLYENENKFKDNNVIEKYGVYLLGVSILYENEAAIDYFLKSGVSPYEIKGSAFAAVVFVINSKDYKIWELIKKNYPISKFQDTVLVDNYMKNCIE
ncbi:hypothetical protein VT06_04935 [Arsukibacterium sp. MJ3]|uniref:hypothetical protein n=1 Tax=Arsukibacterium sp. MJ3 TaxID=1632859 RepID=UPI0006272FBF|nr:hypothetical protein [Arsukibacterium sp. MJ3]KKO49553.1 hypothetical protein VT06_04935 [Arsukibacterium sp. MJ3]